MAAKKRIRSETKTWLVEEERDVPLYLVERPYLGKEQAKETLNQYHKRMLETVNISNCDIKRLQNKIIAMKKKYTETKKWIDETGQGVLENNSESFQDIVKQKCHYYYILNKELGCCQALNPSYQRHEGNAILASESTSSVYEENVNDGTYDAESPTILFEKMQTGIVNEKETAIENEVEKEVEEEIEIEVEVENCSSIDKTKKNRYSNFLKNLKADKCEKRTSAVQKLVTIFNSKCDSKAKIEENKLNWEKEKWKQIQEKEKNEFEADQALQLKKIKLQQDFDLKKDEINKEIEMKRLDIEEKKLQFEIMKFKNEHQNFN